MGLLARHWSRIAITLLPLVFALLHAMGVLPIPFVERLDANLYDARLRASMPGTLDPRVVIIDIDEKSLAEAGRWPWSRNRLAEMVDELFERQKIALLGFDVVFAEPDDSSGLKRLRQMAEDELRDAAGFRQRLQQLQADLDYDAVFARALEKRPVVLGYYFTGEGRKSGVLPAPVMTRESLRGRPIRFTRFSGYGANIEALARAAPMAGHFTPLTDGDGVVRSIPLVAEHDGAYYEALSLAMFRLLVGKPAVEPGFPTEHLAGHDYPGLASLVLRQGRRALPIPVDDRVATLVPFRGPGGPAGGSFRYVSASDVLLHRLPPDDLKDKIVLVGTTAPGLLDLRVTPVGETYPGVETHANLLIGLLDGRLHVKPDYAVGYEVAILLVAGLLLAVLPPILSATLAVPVSFGVVAALLALNYWLFAAHGLVLPLASALVMAGTAFALNMSLRLLRGEPQQARARQPVRHLRPTGAGRRDGEGSRQLQHEGHQQGADRHVLRHAGLHQDVGEDGADAAAGAPERGLQPPHRHHPREPRDHRQVHGRLRHGLLGRAGRHAQARAARGPLGAGHGAVGGADQREPPRQGHPRDRCRHRHQHGHHVRGRHGFRHPPQLYRDRRRREPRLAAGGPVQGLWRGDRGERRRAQAGARVRLAGARPGAREGKGTGGGHLHPRRGGRDARPEVAEELRMWALSYGPTARRTGSTVGCNWRNLRRIHAKKYLYELYSDRVASLRLLPFDPSWDGATTFETK
jgi:CHASE2 domain-containing sensor protein